MNNQYIAEMLTQALVFVPEDKVDLRSQMDIAIHELTAAPEAAE